MQIAVYSMCPELPYIAHYSYHWKAFCHTARGSKQSNMLSIKGCQFAVQKMCLKLVNEATLYSLTSLHSKAANVIWNSF